MVPPRRSLVNVRTPKHVHRRLRPDQVDLVIESYLAGSTLREIGQRFSVHRTTVSELLKARGIKRRYGSLTPEQVDQAVKLYRSGLALAAVAEVLHVQTSTVWLALKRRGIPRRNRQGRERA